MFWATEKQELNFQEKYKQQIIGNGVYMICKNELEKVHQEIKIIESIEYVEEFYHAEISDDNDEESDEESSF